MSNLYWIEFQIHSAFYFCAQFKFKYKIRNPGKQRKRPPPFVTLNIYKESTLLSRAEVAYIPSTFVYAGMR